MSEEKWTLYRRMIVEQSLDDAFKKATLAAIDARLKAIEAENRVSLVKIPS